MNRRGFLASLLGAIAGPPAAAALLLPAPKQEQSGIAIARQAQREWEECPEIHQVAVHFESESEVPDERYLWPAFQALIQHVQDEYERGARGFRSIDLPHIRGAFSAKFTIPSLRPGHNEDFLKPRYVRALDMSPWREDIVWVHRYDLNYWWVREPRPRPSGNRMISQQEFAREALAVLQRNLQATRQINSHWEREFAR